MLLPSLLLLLLLLLFQLPLHASFQRSQPADPFSGTSLKDVRCNPCGTGGDVDDAARECTCHLWTLPEAATVAQRSGQWAQFSAPAAAVVPIISVSATNRLAAADTTVEEEPQPQQPGAMENSRPTCVAAASAE